MTRSDGITSHFPQYLKLALCCPYVECSTKSSQIMVVADTPDLDSFPVKQESITRSEFRVLKPKLIS